MALCIEVQLDGTLTQSATPIDTCTTYVLLYHDEYSNLPSWNELFSIPLQADLQTMFMTGFALPVIAYLTAWAYGLLINFFNPDHNRY